MKKLEIILDSFSGYNEQELKEKGIHFLPQFVTIDGKDYADGRDIKMPEVMKMVQASATTGKVKKDANFPRTSQPSVGEMTDLFDRLSKEPDTHVLFIAMNQGMSSTYSSASAQAKNYPNVTVVTCKMVGNAFIDAVESVRRVWQETNGDIEAVKAIVKKASDNSLCAVLPKTLEAFIRSGRLKGPKKFILTKAKLFPELKVVDSGFEIGALKKGQSILADMVVRGFVEKIGQANLKDYKWEIVNVIDQETVAMAKEKVKSIAGADAGDVPACGAVGIHAGYAAIGIHAWRKV